MEDFEEMEMPTPCSCGEWFDLTDGFASLPDIQTTVCEECHDLQLEIEGLKEEIEELENDIANGYNKRENKKQLNCSKKDLKKLEDKYISRVSGF
ncbi:hypothetical protein SAMN05421786_11518 [Chryseobacterium ureilyticum]|uniref:Uncharacterized protein n=1 Tax=Chryseobacterium ureilyticum TaxID=373668 RepID=A0A1N7QRS9_9FLAO|nr:hypothetical protein [Chryseobacterium ureilyticum]SIT25508.1 hypothetical protein SAMN05421786_11518 [Chryseobacterium ureilyticum]